MLMQDRYQSKVHEPTQEARPRSLETRVRITLMPFLDIESKCPGLGWLNCIGTHMRVIS
jgi:hypothetical protein